MKLNLLSSCEMGSARLSAVVQDPVVDLEPETPGTLRIQEGVLDLTLEFPDNEAVGRFRDRITRELRLARS